jgi:hypothetical protein
MLQVGNVCSFGSRNDRNDNSWNRLSFRSCRRVVDESIRMVEIVLNSRGNTGAPLSIEISGGPEKYRTKNGADDEELS